MPLSAGDKFGPYAIVAPLGAGGMGEVYRASDARLGREVALKILPHDLSRDGSMRARFEQEARAASALNHPNIVSVFDIGQDGDVPYIVSELVEGEPLRAVISRGPVPARKIVDIGRQIADGIAAAHSAGVVHRDLKPENILITRDGRVKIIDFGLAKQMFQGAPGDTVPATLTMPGAVMGTIGYMSPEQIRGQTVDSRTDIFSLGVILYEMAAGRSAFTGMSGADVMSAILREDPPELTSADLPPGLAFVIRRCLEKNPASRFQSASDLAFAINSLSSIPAAVPVVPIKHAAPSPIKSILAVAALCIAGGITYRIVVPRAAKHSKVSETIESPVAGSAPLPAPRQEKPEKRVAVEPPAPAKVVTPEPAKPASETPSPAGRPARAFARGQLLLQDGKYDEAVEAFSEAIRLKPESPMAFWNRGRAFLHQKQLDNALKDFTEAIRLKPDLAFAFVDRGHLYNQQGEYRLAIPDFDEALKLNPDLIRAYEGRAVAKGKTGDRKGAAADRKQAARLKHN